LIIDDKNRLPFHLIVSREMGYISEDDRSGMFFDTDWTDLSQ